MDHTKSRIRAHVCRRIAACAVMVTASVVLTPQMGRAQDRVGSDSSSRLHRYERSILNGAVLGLGYSGIDQLTETPDAWGKGWPGYGKRLASNVGQFAIQETVTDVGAALLHRPLDYPRCKCTHTWNRIGWATKLAFVDQTRSGKLKPAYPRIAGAYAGSFAQASWMPPESRSRTEIALINGTSSLLVNAAVNIYLEFVHKNLAVFAAK
jgi:hypothetical protein